MQEIKIISGKKILSGFLLKQIPKTLMNQSKIFWQTGKC